MTDTNAAANAGAAGQAAQAVGGAAGHTTETHGQALEGSIKQATDINTEETLALLQSLAAKAGIFNSDLTAANAKRTADQAQSTDLLTTGSRPVVNLNRWYIPGSIRQQAGCAIAALFLIGFVLLLVGCALSVLQ